jgi:hypothetical protein
MMLINETTENTPTYAAISSGHPAAGFPSIPASVRPYAIALVLFCILITAIYCGDQQTLSYGLPWELVTLPIIIIASSIWGIWPCIVVLGLSLFVGGAIAINTPDWHWPLSRSLQHVLYVRAIIYLTGGVFSIWLANQIRDLQEKSARSRATTKALETMNVPHALATAPGYDVCGTYHSSNSEGAAGADFYDFFSNGAGEYGILIGEVNDKRDGLPTSTAELRYSCRALAAVGIKPAQLIQEMNGLFERQHSNNSRATLFFGLLDVNSGTLTFANAGCEAPMLLRHGAAEELLAGEEPALGTSSSHVYQSKSVAIEPGDALLLVTDGVTDARDPEGFFLKAEDLWKFFAVSLQFKSSKRSLSSIETSLSRYLNRHDSDDVTMLLLRCG